MNYNEYNAGSISFNCISDFPFTALIFIQSIMQLVARWQARRANTHR